MYWIDWLRKSRNIRQRTRRWRRPSPSCCPQPSPGSGCPRLQRPRRAAIKKRKYLQTNLINYLPHPSTINHREMRLVSLIWIQESYNFIELSFQTFSKSQLVGTRTKHKFLFSNPYIFVLWRYNPWIFHTTPMDDLSEFILKIFKGLRHQVVKV